MYPQEVEEALENIPGIKQALVLGKPDETWGAIVTALLVPENEASKPEAKGYCFWFVQRTCNLQVSSTYFLGPAAPC